MAGEAQDSNWPIPKFYFKVDLGSVKDVFFQEVSGLEVTAQPIEYRHGNSPVFSAINMPGTVKNNKVTLIIGVFAKDNKFWDWYNKIKMNTVERQNVFITLCDEEGNPTTVWTLLNAWPTKIVFSDLESYTNEVAVETIEIFHEGVMIANG
jgi:phage tail-like protein